MPISRGEFERREIDPHLAVLDFLRRRLNDAYTLEEIRANLSSQRQLSIEVLSEVVRSLEEEEKVESATLGDVVYYIYRPLGPGGGRG